MKRVDIISDTHGRLTKELLHAIEGADLVIHAGDITSTRDWEELKSRTRAIQGVLGNNDHYCNYGPELTDLNEFVYEGVRFGVAHYRQDLPVERCDVGVCGHTHRPEIVRSGDCLIINPGSPTCPRGREGPTMARLFVADGRVITCKIVELKRS